MSTTVNSWIMDAIENRSITIAMGTKESMATVVTMNRLLAEVQLYDQLSHSLSSAWATATTLYQRGSTPCLRSFALSPSCASVCRYI